MTALQIVATTLIACAICFVAGIKMNLQAPVAETMARQVLDLTRQMRHLMKKRSEQHRALLTADRILRSVYPSLTAKDLEDIAGIREVMNDAYSDFE